MANRRVALVGCGMVGMSYAYALLNSDLCNELILIDINEEKALGEAMDLNHGLCFSSSHMKIRAGSFEDCQYADLVVITASAGSRKPGQTRLDLLQKNVGVFKSFISKIVASGFNGIFLVASNPVDVMTRLTYELSGFPANRVIGSGTTLDTGGWTTGTCTPSSSASTATANLFRSASLTFQQKMLRNFSAMKDSRTNTNAKILNKSSRRLKHRVQR